MNTMQVYEPPMCCAPDICATDVDPNPAAKTRFFLFTDKGATGKTSFSCATTLTLDSAGNRVLLVSTDWAFNLDEVMETRLIRFVPILDALNNAILRMLQPTASGSTAMAMTPMSLPALDDTVVGSAKYLRSKLS